ncbi:MAG: hypothetical protein IKZ55_05525, partial [Bacteroidales bacterium]|nr:hypothetical protein [Bacteroidales bacterium]
MTQHNAPKNPCAMPRAMFFASSMGGGKSLKTNDLQRFTKFFSLIFIFILLPLAARATITVTHSGGGAGTGTYTTLDAAINACTSTSGTYTITVDADHDLNSTNSANPSSILTVEENVSIVLQSDVPGTKRTLTRTSTNLTSSSSIFVYGTLTVTDLIFDGDSIFIAHYSLFENHPTGNLTMTDCIIHSQITTGMNWGTYGSGLRNSGTATLNNCTITCCEAYGGGAVFQDNENATLTVNGGAITNSRSINRGGGILISGGTVILNGVTISGNKANDGGGIYLYGGTLEVDGCSFIDNFASDGGGCYLYSGTTATFKGNQSFINNGAVRGGGIYSNIDLTISGSIFNGNRAGSQFTTYGDGGGIFMGSNTITLTAIGTTFINNVATGRGGAISTNNGTLTNCIIGTLGNSNSAALSGGGVYCGGGTLAVNGGSCSYNSASSGGGFSISGVAAIFSDSPSITNNCATNGGGVYCYGGTLAVNSGTYAYNTATEKGGGFYLERGTYTLSGSTDINNNSAQNGGGIFHHSDVLTMNGGICAYNTATNDGGGICLNTVYSASFSATGTTFVNNTASRSGGAIYIVRGCTLNNCTIGTSGAPNSAANGGGVYFSSFYDTLTVSGGTCAYNTATENGGGIYLDTGTLDVSGGTYANNTAATDGGGFYLRNGWASFSDSPSINNNGAQNGGGIYSNINLTLNGGFFHGNWASQNGAGVYMAKYLALTATDATFTKNVATGNGGGIYVTGGTLTNCTVGSSGNPNSAANGGGIYLQYGTLSVSGGTYAYNTATTDGGGIYLLNGTLNFSDSPSVNNNSAQNGGGIYSKINHLTLPDMTFDGNTASQDGGGVYAYYQISATGTTFINNSANRNGGGIYASVNYKPTTLTNCTIGTSGNPNSAANGGGVYLYEGPLTMSGGTCAYNTASENGGGFYLSNGPATFSDSPSVNNNSAQNGGGIYSMIDLTLPDMTFDGNTATQDGAGIYLLSGKTLSASNATFTNNAAMRNGGGIYTVGAPNTTTPITITITLTDTLQRVEYLQATGTQWINTGLKLNTDYKFWVDGYVPSNGGALIYAYDDNSKRTGCCVFPSGKMVRSWGSNQTDISAVDLTANGIDVRSRFQVTQDKNGITLEQGVNTYTVSYTGASGSTGTSDILLFKYEHSSFSGSNYMNAIIYEAKIWNASNELIGHYIPCRRENGELGVYDDVTKTFLTNAGSDSFTAGGDVSGQTYTIDFTETVVVNAVTATYNVTLNDCTLGTSGNGNSAAKGGGIYIEKGGVNLNTGSIGHNTASLFGGGVYIATNGELGVSGTVTVKDNTTTRSSSTYDLYLKPSKEDDVCLQTLNDDPATGNIGKIRIKGELGSSTKIGITEEEVASGFHRSLDAEGNKKRQFTLDYGTYYSSKAAEDVFFSNDNVLDIFLLTH